jgi:hypothetical protein
MGMELVVESSFHSFALSCHSPPPSTADPSHFQYNGSPQVPNKIPHGWYRPSIVWCLDSSLTHSLTHSIGENQEDYAIRRGCWQDRPCYADSDMYARASMRQCLEYSYRIVSLVWNYYCCCCSCCCSAKCLELFMQDLLDSTSDVTVSKQSRTMSVSHLYDRSMRMC